MTEPLPRVSVILPTFNRSGYLRQAIESVLAQTYPDFELIVVDDGSTDDTAAVVREFGDPRIVYVWQDNAGRSAARNHGLALARGAYIAFLDDDDLYLAGKLTYQLHFLEQQPDLDCVASEMLNMDADGNISEAGTSLRKRSAIDLLSCLQSCPLATCNVLIRRQALDRMDAWFDTQMHRAEDLDFYLRFLQVGGRAEWLPGPVCINRYHSGNSQQDVVGYRAAYERLLAKLFSEPDRLPQNVREVKVAIYAQYYFKIALRAYALGRWQDGQESLLAAANSGAWPKGDILSQFANEVVGYASQLPDSEAMNFIHFVFDYLPHELKHLQSHRMMALSQLFMGRVFRDASAGRCPCLTDWLRGIAYNPSWLRNRGVWSILVKQVFALPSLKAASGRRSDETR